MLVLACEALTAFAAGGARLVKDIKISGPPLYSFAYPFAVLGNDILFTSFDDGHLSGIWKSDGTPSGTTFLADPCPECGYINCCSYAIAFGDKAVFSAYCLSYGRELWITDGTTEGTSVLKDIRPGPDGDNTLWYAFQAGSRLYFWADDGTHGRELWSTDGTPEGTAMAKDIHPGPSSSRGYEGVALPDSSALFDADDGLNGSELWKSDGTEVGTYLVKDIRPGEEGSRAGSFARLGGVVYFLADDGVHGSELWRTDGTPEGTVLAVDHHSGTSGSISHLLAWNGRLYFWDGYELWRSNGTPTGTQIIKYGFGYAREVMGAANCFYYTTYSSDLQVSQLWRSDGTAAGTVMLKETNSDNDEWGFWSLTLSGGLLYFYIDNYLPYQTHLWRSDGTAVGTFEVASTPPENYGAWYSPSVAHSEYLYFGAAGWGDFGSLWRSDGTMAGTVPAVQINGANSSYPQLFWPQHIGHAAAGRIVFPADDGTHGQELWGSDGTDAGTTLLGDACPGPEGSDPWIWMAATSMGIFIGARNSISNEPCGGFWRTDGTSEGTIHIEGISGGDFRELNGTVLLAGDDGVLGQELWRTDGTEVGTHLIKDIYPGPENSYPVGFGTIGGRLLMFADDGVFGRELWASDGTPAGTVLVKDIYPGPTGSSQYYRPCATGKDDVYFVAVDDVHGTELWKTDGTAAGTELVKDIVPGPESTIWGEKMIAVGDGVLFWADDHIHGLELWVSDGTEIGTHIVKDIFPGNGSQSSFAWSTLVWGDKLVFMVNDGIHGMELWISDGTDSGTHIIKDICPGACSSTPQLLAPAPEGIYFAAFDFEAGYELWRTDGTEAGTMRVADLWPGPEGSVPHDMVRIDDGRLIFAAATPGKGIEVWETDGTAAHTLMAVEVMPGPGSAYPKNFVQAGASVLFQATDGVHGFEVWALPVDAAGAVPDGGNVPGEPLRAMKLGEGALALAWGSSCYYRDGDFAVYSGLLGSWTEAAPETCTTVGERRWKGEIPGGDVFYLVVPQGTGVEGSYGRDGQGVERTPSAKACAPQAVHPCP